MDDESRSRLNINGEYHLGDMINCIQHGSLVMNQATTNTSNDIIMTDVSSSSSSTTTTSSSITSTSSTTKTSIENVTSDICGTLIFGTVSGRIGVIARLSEVQFQFLLQLQSALNEVITSVGNLSHDEWRSFHNDRRYTTKESKSKNFIDGDVIERLLDLNKDKQIAVATLMSKNIIPVGITSNDNGRGGGSSSSTKTRDVSVETLIRIVEDLSRIH